MIDIEKEREAYEEHCKSIGLGQALGKKGGEFADSTMQTAWNGWLSCAESKQCDIDDLKAQINELEQSRMTWREYAVKIESGEYVLISKQCPDPEFADALFDLLDQHAFGEVGQDKFISYSDIDEEKVYALVVNSTQKTKPQKCVWRENEFLGTFHAGCDNLFELMNTDSLAQNKIYYCPFCGKKIDEDFGESEDE